MILKNLPILAELKKLMTDLERKAVTVKLSAEDLPDIDKCITLLTSCAMNAGMVGDTIELRQAAILIAIMEKVRESVRDRVC